MCQRYLMSMNAGRCVKGLKNFKFLETNRESNPSLQRDRIGSTPLDYRALTDGRCYIFLVWLEIGHLRSVEPYLHWGFWLTQNSNTEPCSKLVSSCGRMVKASGSESDSRRFESDRLQKAFPHLSGQSTHYFCLELEINLFGSTLT